MIQELGTAIIVSGPSGVGKSSILKGVTERMSDLRFSVSCTTRSPRNGERNGVEYHFLAREDFERRIAADEFVEYAEVFANYYGTLREEVITPVMNGRNVFLDIDVQGAMQIRKACEQDELLRRVCEFVFIVPPSLEELEQRLRGRATESEEQLALRIGKARAELAYAGSYDYILVNDDLANSVPQMLNLIASFSLSVKRRRVEEFL